ncbi:MAG: AAA domain-containing protein [Elusimicrobia bacterium]|nr:AAA domain-containing protein [Elusimicrobiota bacterium]MBD3412671.1 AAA domain-containing protein [Elusimicrobiota bacterium]
MGNTEKQDVKLVEKLVEGRGSILEQLKKIIVGQQEVVDQLLIGLFARGHCLIVGVPGLAKTLLISSIAEILDLDFKRIQFTPDLMPADITGTDVLEEDKKTKERVFRFIKGPVFGNIILADEINRTPPKTQAALLQAMQEYRVTAGGNTYDLPLPYFVLATQNPIEQEGTYPLPEAQLDRFLMQINIGYPNEAEEKEIVNMTTGAYKAELQKVLNAEEILALQEIVRKVPVSEHVVDYAVRIARSTRPNEEHAPVFAKEWIQWGAGPRASQSLILCAKARAILDGRYAVSTDDIKAVLPQVLRHRIILNFHADAEGVNVEKVIDTVATKIQPADR